MTSRTRHPMLVIGLLGLAVHQLFLWSSRGDPSFEFPLVDAKTYHDLARHFGETGWTEKFLWRAAFYPASPHWSCWTVWLS